MPNSQTIRPAIPEMRWLLLAASFLVFLAGFQLFILTEYTDKYFAWTIQPPLTAAFLGAAYFGSFLLEFLASRERSWSNARIAVPSVFTFTSLTLIATLLHLDRFHFNDQNIIPQIAAWFWLIIYSAVPVAMLIIWNRQRHAPGSDSPRTMRLSVWFRVALAVQATAFLALGIGLFAPPNPLLSFWPWKLTPLTSQAIGAWLIGIGVFAAQSVWENDHRRIRKGLLAYLAVGILELVALVRYPTNMDWLNAFTWMYLILMLTVVALGLYSLAESLRGSKGT